MVVYWDAAAVWNFALDYLLLLGTARLAGRGLRRGRLALGAAFGAAYSVAALALALPLWTILPALAAMGALAFAGTGRSARLTLLFALLACGLGGAVLLLGRVSGGMERLAGAFFYARLPWGVFLAASGITYLLLSLVFRGGARHEGSEYVRARVFLGGRSVTLRLLRDTGNTLTDPETGEGVPVIEKEALAPLFQNGGAPDATHIPDRTLRYHAVGTAEGTLEAFRCERLEAEGRDCGARLIALSPEPLGETYQGLWPAEEKEDLTRDGLSTAVGQAS